MQNKKTIIGLVAVALIILSAIAARLYLEAEPPSQPQADNAIRVEIADTEEERMRGLSGREPLSENEVLLFVFPQAGEWGFWMKDMKFAIDIIWLDADFKVVHIEKNVLPESYPTVFKPEAPALYVVEAVTGFVDARKVIVGSELSLQ